MADGLRDPTPGPHDQASVVRHRRFLDHDEVWTLLRQLGQLARFGQPVCGPARFTLIEDGPWTIHDSRGLRNALPSHLRDDARTVAPDLELSVDGEWSLTRNTTARAQELVDLYLPLCTGASASSYWIGHVGQSLDGFVATTSGESQFITGSENVEHMHRLRALFDAVLVGRATVTHDDPQLTTRLVEGPNPARVIIDPKRRLTADHRVFQNPEAPTFLVCCERSIAPAAPKPADHVTLIPIPESDAGLEPSAIREALAKRGLGRVFVEGGGSTVSRFLCAGALQRLHLTVAPALLGQGQRGLVAPGAEKLSDAWRFNHRRFVQGDDILFDCLLDDVPLRHP